MTLKIAGITGEDIVGRVLSHYNGDVGKVILFGSQARGDADEWSDIDMIVIRDTKERFVERLGNAPLFPVSADVFVYTPEEFERMKENENPFVMSALENSKVIYEKI